MPAPEEDRIVGVFRDHADAQAVARDIQQQGGTVRIGDPLDDLAEVRAEMLAELDATAPMGPPGIAPRGAGRSALLVSAAGAVVGAAITLPFLGVAAWVPLIGAVIGGWLGFVIGGILGNRTESKPLAAERGVTVAASPATDAVAAVMAQHDPIRMDAVDAGGHPRTVLLTEGDLHDGLFAERAGRNLAGHDLERESTGPERDLQPPTP